MKIEELMLGDYVRVNDPNGPFVSMVYGLSIEPSAIYAKEPDLTVAYPYDEDCVDPIPLTPEILEKNGFKSFEHGQIWKERIGMGGQTTSATSPIEVIIYEGGHSVIMNPHEGKEFQGYIGSVHELQRVLRICGIEKEINVN